MSNTTSNTTLVTFLREAGVDLNAPNQDGDPPIIFAVKKNAQHHLFELLRLGVDVNGSNKEGYTALMIAAMTANTECVRLLLSHGADVTLIDKVGRTALMTSVGKLGCGEIVIELIKAGSDINAQSMVGHSALMYASSGYWYGEDVRLLLAAGADINFRDCTGSTALMCAALRARYGDTGTDESNEPADNVMIDLLRAGAPIDDIEYSGRSALILAAKFGRVKCVQTLIQAGANINLKDFHGRTALMYTSMSNTGTAIDRTLEPNFDASARLLLDFGADLDIQDKRSMSALMFAAMYNRCAMLQLLIHNGANLDLTDAEGNPAILHALRAKPEISDSAALNFSIAVRLTECGANPKVRPEHYASLEECISQITDPAVIFNMMNHEYAVRLCIVNGVMPNFGNRGSCFLYFLFHTDVSFDTCKYTVANACVTETELRILRGCDYRHLLTGDRRALAVEMLCNPWPLSKLSLVAVSSAIGMHPGRKERIGQLAETLPEPIKDALMFNSRVAYLPVHHWADIPLAFNAAHYETLHGDTRLFMLYWPCGRELTSCQCEPCKQNGLNFTI